MHMHTCTHAHTYLHRRTHAGTHLDVYTEAKHKHIVYVCIHTSLNIIALCIHTSLCTHSLWTDQWKHRRFKLISWSIYISMWFHLFYPVPENQLESGLSRPSICTALYSWPTQLTISTRTPRSPQISPCLKAEAIPVASVRLSQGSGFSFSHVQ